MMETVGRNFDLARFTTTKLATAGGFAQMTIAQVTTEELVKV
jgi:hypothetical protein